MSGRTLGWIALALSAAAFGIALGFVFGGRDNATGTPAVTTVVQPAAEPPAGVESATTGPWTNTPAPLPTTAQPALTTTPSATQSVDTSGYSAFWSLVDETRRAAGHDTEQQTELLEGRLTRLSPDAIVEFAEIRRRLDREAYTWSMWGAATVIEDGCSDDCFRDFRGYVISLGRDAYEQALRNPDSLASVAHGPETGNWENADDVAPEAYSSLTGHDFPHDVSDLSGPPAGTPLDLESGQLLRLYPELAARFRRS